MRREGNIQACNQTPIRLHRHHLSSSPSTSRPLRLVPIRVLQKRAQDLAARLEQRVARHDAEEALEALPSGLDDLIREPVREDLAWERGDIHAGGLVLEDVAEGFKIRIASAHERVAQLEGRDVRLAYNLIVSVHLTTETMRLGIPHFYL